MRGCEWERAREVSLGYVARKKEDGRGTRGGGFEAWGGANLEYERGEGRGGVKKTWMEFAV